LDQPAEADVIDYLQEENRVLREQCGARRLRLTDDQRRRLAAKGRRLGRRLLREIATIVTPDTLLRFKIRAMIERPTRCPTFFQCSLDSCVAPGGILFSHPQRQAPNLRQHSTTSCATSGVRPLPGDELPMPARNQG
jgi:hypothetical protein